MTQNKNPGEMLRSCEYHSLQQQESFRSLGAIITNSVICKTYDFEIGAVDWRLTNTVMSFAVRRYSFCFFSHSKCTLTSCYAWCCHHFCQKQHLPPVPCFSAVPLQNNVCSSLKICRTNWESTHHTGSSNQTGEERHEIWSWLLTPLRGCATAFHTSCKQWRSPAGRPVGRPWWQSDHVVMRARAAVTRSLQSK